MTVVLNPNARKLKLQARSVEDFRKLLPPDSEIHLTRDLDELDALMGNWAHGERTVCFFGGDGSISRGITSLIQHHGEDIALPPVLPVRAGTMNFLCNLSHQRESANQTLERWSDNRGSLSIREVPTLRVQVGDQKPRYGFVFAWGIGYRVLTEYYRRNKSPNLMDGAVVATQAFIQAVNPFNEDLPLFRREEIGLSVNGKPVAADPMHTLTVGTISRISLGIRPFPHGEVRPGGFHFSANGMPLYRVAANVPTLLFGMSDQSELDFGPKLVNGKQVGEIECELTDGFTLDGELFELPARNRVRISAGPVAKFWTQTPSVGREVTRH